MKYTLIALGQTVTCLILIGFALVTGKIWMPVYILGLILVIAQAWGWAMGMNTAVKWKDIAFLHMNGKTKDENRGTDTNTIQV